MKRKTIITAAASLLAGAFLLAPTAQASRMVTPAIEGGSRYQTRRANYQMKTKSGHYRYVYNQALNAWERRGFAWHRVGRSKTTLATVYDK